MRVLLDEDLDVRFRRELASHEVFTVEYMGWKGISNGELLALADTQFDALVTADQSLPGEQDLTRLRRVGIVRVRGYRITLDTLRSAVPPILAALSRIRPGSVETVEI